MKGRDAYMKRITNKKFRKIGLLIGCAMMLLSACGNKADEMEAKIKADYFDQETEIGRLLSEYVVIDVKEVKKDFLTVEVKAPSVTETLWAWFEENDFTEEGFDAALENAMKQSGDAEEFQLALGEGGSIEYTEDFSNLMSAGLPEFYYKLQYHVIEELKEAANEQE